MTTRITLDITITDDSINIEEFNDLVKEKGGKKQAIIYLWQLHKLPSVNAGTKDSTIEKITAKVQAQMELNANTDKTQRVGVGKNAKEVKYEQRTITMKWIMRECHCTQQAATEYLIAHQAEIDAHHKEVLGLTDSKEIQNFNRTPGIAARIANQVTV